MAFELVEIKKEIDILGFHSLYYFELDKYFYHLPERHDFWELVYVDSGKINAITDGIGYSLNQGQVIFHKPMELHTHVGNQKDPSNLVVVSFSCQSELMSYFNKKIFDLDQKTKKVLSLFLEEAKNALGELPQQFEDTSPLDFGSAQMGATQMMVCYLTEFLISLLRRGEALFFPLKQTQGTKRQAENSMAEAIEAYLVKNLYRPLTLQNLSDQFMVSKTYLCRIFKAGTGQSPIERLLDLKIKEAKRFIRKEEENMTQIAEQLGFTSIHHFTRAFKGRTGLSPSAYKHSVRQQE